MQANPPDIDDLIRRAEEGERFALERVYGHAAAWLASGQTPPEPLGSWIAGRLQELARAIGKAKAKDNGRQLEAATAHAMRVRRAGKRGRPRSRSSELRQQQLARDVQEFIRRGFTPYQACAEVAKYHREHGDESVELKTIEAAWREFGAPQK